MLLLIEHGCFAFEFKILNIQIYIYNTLQYLHLCIFSPFPFSQLTLQFYCRKSKKFFFYIYTFGEISKGSLFKVPRGHKPSKGPCKAPHKISQLTCEGLGRSSTRFLMCWRRTWLAARYKGGPSFIWYPTSRKPEYVISCIQPHLNLNL